MEAQIEMFEEYEPQEDESDLDVLTNEALSGAVVNATDWTVETMLSQIEKGNILLNPKFQRRDAWKRKRKSEFIESLFLGLPVPQIVLASHKDKKGKYIVIDGKQRLLSIRQFASSDDDEFFEQLKLGSLSVKSDLNGKALLDLQKDPQFSEDVNEFENETIRTVVIKHWPNEEFLYRVFLRLNTNSVGLSPQELRQALHPGPFIDYADMASQNSPAIKDILNINKPDFRMRDVEIFIRYIAFRLYIHEYTGSMKYFLDTTCERLNSEWARKEDQVIRITEELELAHSITRDVFGEHAYRKWVGDKYESRFNRAIFDVMSFYFVKEEVARRVEGNEEALQQAFKDLCEKDSDFLASIERTTKTLDATVCRLSKWAEALNNTLGTSLPLLAIQNKRIV